MKKLFSVLVFLLLNRFLFPATIDTVSVYSNSMQKNIKNVIILPEDYYRSGKSFPVVYLLHGAGGDYSSFIRKIPELADYSDQYSLIILCPDGGGTSWYFDSPADSSFRYETYISKELVEFTDKNYRTIKNKEGRAITGISMGGHGAFYLAFRHQDTWGAAGSISGLFDLTLFPQNWDIAKRLGKLSGNETLWKNNSVINMTGMIHDTPLQLIIHCGKEDFFYPSNVALHRKLTAMNRRHQYYISAGEHSWNYWKPVIKTQLEFFARYFSP